MRTSATIYAGWTADSCEGNRYVNLPKLDSSAQIQSNRRISSCSLKHALPEMQGLTYGRRRRQSTQLHSILYFPFHQTFEEIEAVGIALQSDYPASSPITESKFFGNQQAPISGDAFDAGSGTTFSL